MGVVTWSIEDFPRVRIVAVVRDVVRHECDNVVIVQATCFQNLKGMADICLMPVVIIASGTGDQNW